MYSPELKKILIGEGFIKLEIVCDADNIPWRLANFLKPFAVSGKKSIIVEDTIDNMLAIEQLALRHALTVNRIKEV